MYVCALTATANGNADILALVTRRAIVLVHTHLVKQTGAEYKKWPPLVEYLGPVAMISRVQTTQGSTQTNLHF